jgi:DNA-directed RNA polymerase subunit K/omega
MIRPPAEMGSFEFVVLARLRAAQLTRGCVPRVTGEHSTAVIAQREIAEGKVIPTWSARGVTPGAAPLERQR